MVAAAKSKKPDIHSSDLFYQENVHQRQVARVVSTPARMGLVMDPMDNMNMEAAVNMRRMVDSQADPMMSKAPLIRPPDPMPVTTRRAMNIGLVVAEQDRKLTVPEPRPTRTMTHHSGYRFRWSMSVVRPTAS